MACQVAERALGFPGINRIHTDACALPADCEFNQRVLNAMHVRSLVSDEDMRRIPRSGPLIVVANHPFGGLEGIVLSALRGVRNDVKLLANYLLGCIPEMRDSFIFVDPFGGSAAKLKNVAGMKEAIRWVREGRALGVFPSGEVSHLTWGRRYVTDPPWSESIARLVQQTGAAVLPIYFAGRNSALFQVAGLIHPRLRTALLPREIAAKQSSSVEIHIGNVITPQRAAQFSDAADLTAFMRLRTYLLKGRAIGASAKTIKKSQIPQKTGREKTIVAAQPQRLMVDEVGRLPADECLFASGDYQVFVTTAASIPTTLREIGRLRELTFRAVGEGTGREIDLDRFDEHYRHLFVWNNSREEIVGAYRLGLSDEILATKGIDGFYTRTLFRYDERLLRQIGPSLEAGRSFVTAAYQKSHSALSMLWKGVGRFAVANPRYRNIFGPVSISDRYHSMTKQLLMAFLGTADHRADLHALVRPTNPPRWGRIRDCDAEHLSTIVRSVEDVEELVGEIESDRRGMPVLLRQYLTLNAKLLGFNIDPDFGDVLDGLVLIDLSKVNRTILDYYMGRQGAKEFLKHHVRFAAES
ncbi:MAG: lysophospholipid acyltransferase family protein [Planctomycetes bacterium]|nr:lysophospholipid acyltransferase family protein [Planctomycetota bacterium]